jgi:hypothetical protein
VRELNDPGGNGCFVAASLDIWKQRFTKVSKIHNTSTLSMPESATVLAGHGIDQATRRTRFKTDLEPKFLHVVILRASENVIVL